MRLNTDGFAIDVCSPVELFFRVSLPAPPGELSSSDSFDHACY